jgi:hypothetical protein
MGDTLSAKFAKFVTARKEDYQNYIYIILRHAVARLVQPLR